jgi:hypothetical protein
VGLGPLEHHTARPCRRPGGSVPGRGQGLTPLCPCLKLFWLAGCMRMQRAQTCAASPHSACLSLFGPDVHPPCTLRRAGRARAVSGWGGRCSSMSLPPITFVHLLGLQPSLHMATAAHLVLLAACSLAFGGARRLRRVSCRSRGCGCLPCCMFLTLGAFSCFAPAGCCWCLVPSCIMGLKQEGQALAAPLWPLRRRRRGRAGRLQGLHLCA